jgi:hypothetical protein
MWLFTKYGFYSIVRAPAADGQPPDTMAIRARRLQDLEALRPFTPIGSIVKTPERDYPFRCFLTSEQTCTLLSDLGETIDYENFKEKISAQSRFRARLYGVIWTVMQNLEVRQRKGEY